MPDEKEDYAEICNKYFGIYNQEASKVMPSFLDRMEWKEGEAIMDHGCGTGQICQTHIVPRIKPGSKIYELDVAETMINFAKKTYGDNPQLEFCQADLLDPDFPLADVKFDKIVSVFVVMLIPRYRETLQKMYDLLKPGGYLVVLDVSESPEFALFDYIKKHPDWEEHGKNIVLQDWHHLSQSQPSNEDKATLTCHATRYTNMLTEIGFNVLESEAIVDSHTWPTPEDAGDFFLSRDPHPHETNLEHDDHHKNLRETYQEFFRSQVPKCASGNPLTKAHDEGFTIYFECIHTFSQKPE